MNTLRQEFMLILLLLLAPQADFTGLAPQLNAQQKSQASDEAMYPDEFTDLLKNAWTFLKDETDAYFAAVEKKNEFETTSEYEQRIIELRRQYLAKTLKYQRDKKFDQKEWNVLFKANLLSYDADRQLYQITSTDMVDFPHTIPTVQCILPSNQFVGVADSISRGYRSSSIYLKLNPPLRIQIARDVARTIKAEEKELYFQVSFTIDAAQTDIRNAARLVVTPRRIQLVHNKAKTVYWEQQL